MEVIEDITLLRSIGFLFLTFSVIGMVCYFVMTEKETNRVVKKVQVKSKKPAFAVKRISRLFS